MEWHINPKQLLKFLGSNHYICGWLAIKLEKMFVRVKIHLQLGSSSRDADGRSFQRYGDGSFDDCVKNRGLIGGGVSVAPA